MPGKAKPQNLMNMVDSISQRVTRIARFAVFTLLLTVAPTMQAQSFTVLHYFTGTGDGAEPTAGVLPDDKENVYGTTNRGGSFNYGTVFRLDASGQETLLHNFLGGEGLFPSGSLIADPAGNLYGVASDGGAPEGGGCAHGCGSIFRRDRNGNSAVLYAFTGKSDGGGPQGALVRDDAGNLYGTTQSGGQESCDGGYGYCGAIFKLDSTNRETVLYRFTGGVDGQYPYGIIADAAGNLYGTTYSGGVYGKGSVYELEANGTFEVLYSFPGGANSSDPNGSLIIDAKGNLYGTTYGGGLQNDDYGIVYKLDPVGNLTVLYSFMGGSDGEFPSSLVMDSAGNLYGVTQVGGTGCYYFSGCGTVFKLDTRGHKTTLHDFTGQDGEMPNSLTMDGSGTLYGTTVGGGIGNGCSYYHGCGTVFKMGR